MSRLDKILGTFKKVSDQLDRYMVKQGKIVEKQQIVISKASALQHTATIEASRAERVRNRLEKLIGD